MRREQIEHAHRVAGCAIKAFGAEPQLRQVQEEAGENIIGRKLGQMIIEAES